MPKIVRTEVVFNFKVCELVSLIVSNEPFYIWQIANDANNANNANNAIWLVKSLENVND